MEEQLELELLRVCRPFAAPPSTIAGDHHSSGQAAALFSCFFSFSCCNSSSVYRRLRVNDLQFLPIGACGRIEWRDVGEDMR
ncbi:unnamed protein product [Cuscuta campestris]|uniref:Uncharacterized protein n=1 Tax=Cuscuta campestris TaxID=132261 RepID=A0A484KYY9_9ASTE|nr:unnamed protein product [Cuscuta campestris]